MPKYMFIMRDSAEAQAAAKEQLDFEEIINMMGRYNESMIKAGVLVGGDGLTDAKEGVVVDFSSTPPSVTDGPYGEVNELFNGFWIVEVSSKEEAIEWASRAPLGPGVKLEVRRIADDSDFEQYQDNEYIQKEKEWRAQSH